MRFDFHSSLALRGENLTQPVQFLPGCRTKPAPAAGIFMAELTHLPAFEGISPFYSENTTMAQPLLKGDLR